MTMTDRYLLILGYIARAEVVQPLGGMRSDRGWYNEVARWYNRLVEGAETCYKADL